MKITKIDAKRRLVLPGANPGETYAVWQAEPGHYALTKIIATSKQTKPTPRTIDAMLKASALTPKMTSKKLRNLTREP